MKDLIEHALNTAGVLDTDYADIRVIERQSEAITVKNNVVEEITTSFDSGFGIRVLKNGVWGFAGSFDLSRSAIDKTVALAVKIAEASALVKNHDVLLTPAPRVTDKFETGFKIDPFSVSLEQKLDLLLTADQAMREDKRIKVSEASMSVWKKRQTFASSEGSWIEQSFTACGAGISAIAIEGNEMQQRSYPGAFGGNFACRGYEFIEQYDFIGNAPRIADEAVALLTADECPSKTTALILDSSQLALQIHESCGHPTELDRVLGMEASFAGTSFLTPEKLGNFQYGSELVNIYADATIPGALGSFGYDDEGIEAQRFDLVRNGLFFGYLTSRETASSVGQASNGCMRADNWNKIPLIRMTNISLEPGNWKLDDLITDTEDGIFMENTKSWSIDDKRLNFQFACEIGWLIKNGKKIKMVKNPNYTGMTPSFWNSCDAITDRKHWQIWGINNCGKGEPIQIIHVGHGASPARFQSVKIGMGK